MIQFVGDDEVFFSQNRRHRTCVCSEPRLEDHTGFDVLEARDLFFQLHMDSHGAGDRAHGARANPILLSSRERSLPQLRVSSQPKIVIRGKIDDLLAVKRTHRLLFVFEYTQFEVCPFCFELIDVIGEERKRIDAGCCRHDTIE